MAGTSEGAKKAAQVRDPEERREAARKGGQNSHGGKSEAATKQGANLDTSEIGQGGNKE